MSRFVIACFWQAVLFWTVSLGINTNFTTRLLGASRSFTVSESIEDTTQNYSIGGQNFSFSLWLKTNTTGGNLVSCVTNSGGNDVNHFVIQVADDGTLEVQTSNGNLRTTPRVVDDFIDHTVVVTYNTEGLTILLDDWTFENSSIAIQSQICSQLILAGQFDGELKEVYYSNRGWDSQEAKGIVAEPYIGCFEERVKDREFVATPGTYTPALLTATECRRLCALNRFRYAGLFMGTKCYCGATFGRHGPSATTNCGSVCAGNTNDACGGNSQVISVYRSKNLLTESYTSIVITKLDTVRRVYNETSLEAALVTSNGAADSYSFVIGDGTNIRNLEELGVQQHKFRLPGKIPVTVTATDSFGTTLRGAIVARVEYAIENAELICPTHVSNVEFSCRLRIGQGSNMNALVNFGDGSRTSFRLPDTKTIVLGSIESGDATTLAMEPGLLLLPQLMFRDNGTITAFEMNMKTAGTVNIQIYRPYCGSGTVYCYQANACISELANCKAQADIMTTSRCSNGKTFNLGNRKCTQRGTGAVDEDFSYGYLPLSYYLVEEYSFGVEATGVQLVNVTDFEKVAVEKGDIPAVFVSNDNGVGSIAVMDASVNKGSVFIQDPTSLTNFTDRNSSQVVITPGDVTGNVTRKLLLKVYTVRPLNVRAPHSYTMVNSNQVNISASINNSISSVHLTATVTVRIPVANLSIVADDAGETFQHLSVTIPAHPGTAVTYTWDWGDGTPDTVTTARYTTHLYSQPGIYNVTLNGANEVSSETVMKSITIQDAVEYLHVDLDKPIATVFGETTAFVISLSQGTDVALQVDFGDGSSYNISNLAMEANVAVDPPALWHFHRSPGLDINTAVVNSTAGVDEEQCFKECVVSEMTGADCLAFITIPTALACNWYGESLWDSPMKLLKSDPENTLYTVDRRRFHKDLLTLVPSDKVSFSDNGTEYSGINLTRIGDPSFTQPISDATSLTYKIRLPSISKLVGIQLQGNPSLDNWVTDFILSTSLDGVVWEPANISCPNSGCGNTDRNGVISRELPWTIARFVKFRPTAANGRADFRIGLSGIIAVTQRLMVNHTYNAPGTYNVTITGNNLINAMTDSLLSRVQIPLTNFTLHTPNTARFGDNSLVTFTASTGTGVELAGTFLGNPIALNDYNPLTLTGSFNVLAPAIGGHDVNVSAYNWVSPVQYQHTVVWADYAITNLSVTTTITLIPSGSQIQFTVSMDLGSRISIEADFGSGLEVLDQKDLMTANTPFNVSRSFETPGMIPVSFTISNDVSSETVVIPIFVQNLVRGLTVTTNSPRPIPFESNGLVTFSVIYSGNNSEIPTNASISFDYGDNSTEIQELTVMSDNGTFVTKIDSSTTFDVSHSYTGFGTFSANIIIANDVGKMSFSKIVVVDEVIEGLALTPSNLLLTVGENTTFIVTKTWGTRMNCNFDFGDGTSNGNTYVTRNEENTISHQYSKPGVFRPSVTGENSIDSATASLVPGRTIIVQHGVQDFSLSGKSMGLLPLEANPRIIEKTFSLTYPPGTTLPTNASYVIDYDDGTVSESTLLTCSEHSLSDSVKECIRFGPHTYITPGTYNVTVVVSNLVSKELYSFVHVIYEEITGLEKSVFFMNKTDKQTGFGSQQRYFPLEKKVLFVVNHTTGTGVTYIWNFGDNTPLVTSSVSTTEHLFQSPGNFTVTLNASNPFGNEIISSYVVMQRSIGGIIFYDDNARAINVSHPFFIDMGSVGTDACYQVTYPDPRATPPAILIGHEAQCQLSFPDNMEHWTAKTSTELELTGRLSFAVVFQVLGAHNAHLSIVNRVSRYSGEMTYKVTRGPCYDPKVNLTRLNSCTVGLDCVNNHTSVKRHKRSETLRVYSDVTLNCSNTDIAHFKWKVEYFSTHHSAWEDVTNTIESLGVAVNSTQLRTLYIDALQVKRLAYGRYRFSIQVSMDSEIGIENSDSVEIEIVQTPLHVSLFGGSRQRRGYGVNITFNGFAKSYDPDLVDLTDKSGMSCQWYCKRSTEAWPWESQPTAGVPGTSGGCFQTGQLKTPGLLPETPALPPSPEEEADYPFTHQYLPNCTLWVDTNYLFENRTHDIMLSVRKTGSSTSMERMMNFTQKVEIVNGEPPQLQSTCVSNCRSKLNPANKLLLKSNIIGWKRGIEYVYNWRIMNEVDETYWNSENWEKFASTGTSSENMALEPNLFGAEHFGKRYCLVVRAYRRTSGPDNYGEYFFCFEVNTPPLIDNVNCILTPRSGMALNTSFSLHCKGFQDNDLPMLYELEGVAVDSQTPEFDGFRLSAGSPSNDYNRDLIVKATDSIKSTSQEFKVSVKVEQPQMNMADMSNMADNLIADSIKSGDPAQTASVVSTFALTLNIGPTSSADASADTGTGASGNTGVTLSPEEEQKRREEEAAALRARRELRAKLMKTMADLPEPKDLAATKQMAAVTVQLTANPNELIPEAQANAAKAGITLAQSLFNVAGDDNNDLDELEKAGGNVLNIISNVLQASSTTSNTSTDSGASSEQQKSLLGNIELIKEKMFKAIDQKVITGQAPVSFNAPFVNMSLSKIFTSEITKAPLKTDGGDGGEFQLPSPDDIFNDDTNGTERTYFVSAQASVEASNPYTWTVIGVNSMVITLKLKNETGGAIKVGGLPNPIKMYVPMSGSQIPAPEPQKTQPVGTPPLVHTTLVPMSGALFITVNCFVNVTRNETGNSTSETRNSTTVGEASGNMTGAANGTDDCPELVFIVFVKEGNRKASEDSYDYTCVLPNPETDSFPNRCYFDHKALNTSTEKRFSLSVRAVVLDNSTREAYRDRNATALLKDNSTVSAGYTMSLYSMACLYMDTERDDYSDEGCTVGPKTTVDAAQCFCDHLTSFGSSFYVPMNTIRPADSGFLKLDENPIVFSFGVVVLCLYFVLLIWARKADTKDIEKVGVTPLPDNDARDKQGYEIMVWTGSRKDAGTTAHVSIILSGDKDETEPRVLADDKRPICQRGGIDSFLLTTTQSLGKLSHLRIWHDNSGSNPSWYFSRMLVEDLLTGEKYYFMCNRWLAVEEDDGQIDRVIPVAGKNEMTNFDYLFWSKTKRNLSDGHIWFSVLKRPPRSKFTRVQRLTCCISLLFSTMATNIMYYGAESSVDSPTMLTIGPIKFSLHAIYIGVITSLIAFPINLIVVACFRYRHEKPSKKKMRGDATDQASLPEISITSEERLSKELEQQREFLDTGDENKRTLRLMTPRPASKQGTVRPSTAATGYTGQCLPAYVTPTSGQLNARPQTCRKKEMKNKKKWRLPWWFIFVGYFLAFVTIVGGFYYCVEVAAVFGEKLAMEWLVSFLTGIVESVFFTQPLKVLLFALFYALVIRSPESDEDEEYSDLRDDEEYLHAKTLMETKTGKDRNSRGAKTYPPLDEQVVKAARDLRIKELEMHKIIREIVFYFVFLLLLMMCAYGNRDPWSIYQKENAHSIFFDGHVTANSTYLGKEFPIWKVKSRKTFFDWAERTLIPALYNGDLEWYNGAVAAWARGFIADKQNYLVGVARLRQLRVKPYSCDLPKMVRNTIKECRSEYEWIEEETGSFLPEWKPVNDSGVSPSPGQQWSFQSALDLKGFPYWGLMTTYGGGGYAFELGTTYESALTGIKELRSSRWLDIYTRVVFVEFVLYNANLNLFTVSQTTVEFPASGGVFLFPRFHVFRLDRYVGTVMFVIMGAEILTAAFFAYFLYREIKKIIKYRGEYFKDTWNVVEFFFLAGVTATIVMFAFKLVTAKLTLGEIAAEPTKFHNLQYSILWDEIYGYMMGFIIFVANVKFLKILRFNKTMNLLGRVMKGAAKPLGYFFISAGIVFFAFVQLAYIMFHTVLLDFMSIITTVETLLVMLMNKFDFFAFNDADRVFGPIFFMIYTVTVSFILISMMLSIIMETYTSVRSDLDKKGNDYEIIDFTIRRLKAFIGIGSGPRNDLQLHRYHEYTEGEKVGVKECDDLNDRMGELLDHFDMYIKKSSQTKDLFDMMVPNEEMADDDPSDHMKKAKAKKKLYFAN
ncbi:uncharacterized protein LOC106182109 [Lingula anatina]|uniref:Uncharacterized protein LOC106182109 n=1 Tax=Lingula anatina TaxID=7574 RepID=A0A1S3KIA9_LINAN|nr:uncharacterized protein LOC106182109 [Lingula anatina]|eukprot:XP_013422214.1 uncharacterized protein LOC106182109 [Lingula anatina]